MIIPEQAATRIEPERQSLAPRGSLRSRIRQQRLLLVLLIPGLLFFAIFHYAPLYGIIVAFKDYIPPLGIVGSPWVGLRNFERIFRLGFGLQVIRNTLVISGLKLLFVFPAPIILAILINEIRRKRTKRIIQTISYLPHFLSWVIVAGMVIELLSPSRGLYGVIARAFDWELTVPMADTRYFRSILVVSDIWKSAGWGSILYLAAIAGIDTDQYEAAVVDGASRFRQILHITLPGILPVASILFIFQVSDILEVGFDQVFNLMNPAVFEVADVLDTYIYRIGLADGDFGYSTAINLSRNLVALVLLLAANWISRKVTQYGLW